MAETTKNKNEARVTIESKEGTQKHVGGEITLSEDVVAKIAGLAARQIDGIHSLGRSRLVQFGDSPTRGIEAEVGKKEAALDLDVIIEYGVDIRQVAQQLRDRIADEVNKMAGRNVVEVNININDVHLPSKETKEKEEEPASPEPKPRVE